MPKYRYNGPVGHNNDWSGPYFKAETVADNEKIALCNIRYQCAKSARVNICFVQVDKKYLREV